MMRAKDKADIRPAFKAMNSENISQIQKWGMQDRTLMEWLCYLTEEVGELAEAIAEAEYRGGDPANIRAEAIQVATLAAKIAIMPFS